MPWSSSEPEGFVAALEKEGESGVREALDREEKWVTLEGRRKITEGWLRSKEAERRDAREIEILSIAREANKIARLEATAASRSARYAMYAAIIAAIGAIAAAKAEIHELIFSLLP